MFKRKDEDYDLLGESTDATATTSENTESAMTNTPTPSTAQPSAYTPATPATPAAGYTRPSESGDAGRLARPSSFRPGAAAAPASPAGRAGNDYRPAGGSAYGSSYAGADASTGSGAGKASGRRVLTVGHDILLKGEIATCDRLVIEGAVDATLNEVHTVEIAQTGSFKGAAEIEDAEISGTFDGELIVRNRLVIYSTGVVRGTITYGEIEIERGGELTGTIKTIKQESDKKSGKKEKAAA